MADLSQKYGAFSTPINNEQSQSRIYSTRRLLYNDVELKPAKNYCANPAASEKVLNKNCVS